MIRCSLPILMALLLAQAGFTQSVDGDPLPGTKQLAWSGDLAARMVAGVDKFLLRKTDEAAKTRSQHWSRDLSSAEAHRKSIAPNRRRLAHILGVRDDRAPFDAPRLLATTDRSALVGKGNGYEIYAVSWPAFGDVTAEGLLLTPANGRAPVANVVALPDADQSPEMIAGLVEGVPDGSQFARRLAESGCRVLAPTLISRKMEKRRNRANLTHREFIYRSAFELGRHILGYEIQKTLAAVDWMENDSQAETPTGVIGYGEGGLLALYAAALDDRIDAACVSGAFGTAEDRWKEPVSRNVFGLLEQFGDAELAAMAAPRPVVIEAAKAPNVTLPSEGGAPGRIVTPDADTVRREVRRANELVKGLASSDSVSVALSGDGHGPFGSQPALASFLSALSEKASLAPDGKAPRRLRDEFDFDRRMARQLHELDRHNQWLLLESQYVRADYMKGLDTSSLEAYKKSVEPYRQAFRHDIIGHFDDRPLPPAPRTRQAYETDQWTGYEVVLDVFPDVFAYGILLLPKDIKPGERRPVVVCQHGLEGRPQDVVSGGHRAYHDFAAKLCERGFITFAPQNLYIGRDDFRTLQRKANPIKKTLFSVIAPQHRQTLKWLSSLPYVDPDRIGFYGLSYGGKSAMRIPALVEEYCLSICSADFNEWVWKNASSRAKYSYVWTGEYEIFEFDLGSTFNYAEMASLICPRPFMVERGHNDGVAPDEKVAHEFAKVRRLYAARLGIPDRCEIEWFYGKYKGVHTINAQGTFAFLHKHLNWPEN